MTSILQEHGRLMPALILSMFGRKMRAGNGEIILKAREHVLF